MKRLPWEPHPEGGFISYPEGKQRPERHARLTPFITGPSGSYTWAVRYDGQAISDISVSKQSASDAANAAWPRVIKAAEVAARRAAWEANELEMIAKAERGEVDPSYFANTSADYENMMWVMERIKPRPGFGGTISAGLQRVVDALSREFARRRK